MFDLGLLVGRSCTSKEDRRKSITHSSLTSAHHLHSMSCVWLCWRTDVFILTAERQTGSISFYRVWRTDDNEIVRPSPTHGEPAAPASFLCLQKWEAEGSIRFLKMIPNLKAAMMMCIRRWCNTYAICNAIHANGYELWQTQKQPPLIAIGPFTLNEFNSQQQNHQATTITVDSPTKNLE